MTDSEIIQRLILFNLDNLDIDIAKSFFNEKDIANRIFGLKEIDVSKWSKNKVLLIGVYLHIYSALHAKNIISDSRLIKLRKILNISEDFIKDFNFALQQLPKKIILNGRSALEAIIEPSEQFSAWADDFVYKAKGNGLYIKKKILTGLKSSFYEHPLDREALQNLEGTPALELLTRKFNEYGFEKFTKINYMGSNIKVSETSLPELYKMLIYVCNILDFSPIPDLYIEIGFINAKTMGSEKPIIVLSSGCIGLMTYDELLFMLGHEVGHIKSQHVLYHQIADIFPLMAEAFSSVTLGLGNLISVGLELALLNWQRKSEYTADRAGLLACQNIDAAATAMMKVAGAPVKYYDTLDPDEFKKQALDFKTLDDQNLDKIAKFISVLFADHPWTVERGQKLYEWVDSGEYEQILNRINSINILENKQQLNFVDQFCANCGSTYEKDCCFCANCGEKRI